MSGTIDKKRVESYISIVAFFLLTSTTAIAASADESNQPVLGTGLFVAFAIAYLSRRRAIGGWLLYFYIQLYFSLLFSLLFLPQVLSDLNPNYWEESLLYVMYFLSVVPLILAQLVEAGVATVLLFQRSESNVKKLRVTLCILILASTAAFAVDLFYFTDEPALFFDGITLMFSIIWTFYFLNSKRVKSVFIDNDWSYVPYSEKRALTSEDKKRLTKRAAISAIVTFVILLIMMGSVLQDEGTQPDMGIFAVPLFYGLIAAIVAWYIPVRKKRQGITNESDT